eukprot:1169704-Heterocapsa_arctica.AAC.1
MPFAKWCPICVKARAGLADQRVQLTIFEPPPVHGIVDQRLSTILGEPPPVHGIDELLRGRKSSLRVSPRSKRKWIRGVEARPHR